ncbi:hypothetical protein Poly41_70050 [Novipirellula artificiosorum]|uniref:Uncharacterized protein n=1 Tax=Novipirellula artificiosorum TaxID=2528016 RepID=A0A5C6CWX7_9BACT|nr:hypothetical protein Poly41_70050 [Novipirellula artificiosorum]
MRHLQMENRTSVPATQYQAIRFFRRAPHIASRHSNCSAAAASAARMPDTAL